MKSENIKFFVILGINLLTICLLTVINSRLSSWGIFLYLPGLFFFLSCIFLNTKRGIIICLLTGSFIDVLLNTPFGFHGLLLALFHIIGKEWLRGSGNYKLWRSVVFQLCTNILLSSVLFFWVFFNYHSGMRWTLPRFFSDIFISSIIMVPLGFWLSQITEILINPRTNHNYKAENHL